MRDKQTIDELEQLVALLTEGLSIQTRKAAVAEAEAERLRGLVESLGGHVPRGGRQ